MIYDTSQTIQSAVHQFYLDREGQPELMPLGIPPLDKELGGLGPGAVGILAAGTGVGKSSAVLSAMLNSSIPVGLVSLEDGSDVVGTRLLAALSGINSLKIRRKDLTVEELEVIRTARAPDHMYFSYPTAGSIEDVGNSIDELCAAGCKLIWIDYIQKIRGHHQERRHEVSESLTRIQRALTRGGAAGMVISQFRRLGREEHVPTINMLKEAGDLENESRIIILANRVRSDDEDRVRFRLGKSTFGALGTAYDMVRDGGGTLRHAYFLDHGENF